MAKDVSKFTEFYYYDGNSFQRCLIIDELSNSMLDKNVSELVAYAGSGGFSTLVTEAKVENKCLYKVGNVPNLFYVRTPYGWELLMTETMDVKVKGLDCIDNVAIDVRPVLLVNISDSYDMEAYTFSELSTGEMFNPIVKAVPKVVHTDVYELSPVHVSAIDGISDATISFLNNLNYTLSEVSDLKALNPRDILTSSDVTITIS